MACHVMIYEGGPEDLFRVDSSISKNTTDSILISSSQERDALQRECSTYIADMLLSVTRIILTEIRRTIDIQSEKKAVTNDSKRELWEILMGDASMPDTSPDAVQEYSEALKAIVPTDGEENPLIDRLRELRGK
jgi:hypothetical protein